MKSAFVILKDLNKGIRLLALGSITGALIAGCGGGPTSGSSSPTISSISPSGGPVGTSVTITGTNFDTSAANNTVTFNGISASVSASSSTSLNANVPTGATSGSVNITTAGGTATSVGVFDVGANLIASPPLTSILGLIEVPGSGYTTFTGPSYYLYGRFLYNFSNTGGFSFAYTTDVGVPPHLRLIVTLSPSVRSNWIDCSPIATDPGPCSSIGITVSRAGTITFASTPVTNSINGLTGTMSGTFSFTPF